MCYNVLNFPLGDMPDREDTLAVILEYYMPDLLILQELKALYSLNVATEILNNTGLANYQNSTYVAQQSGGGGGLQQALVYNSDIFGIASEEVILTPVRDVNYVKLYLKEAGLNELSDTTYLHVYNTHLKASSGSSNQQLRLQSVEAALPHLNELNDDERVIFAGDFNVYNSSEPAYQALLDSDNSPRLRDPLNAPGNWGSSSYPLKEILTQSTRTSQVFGDGAGGGVDDRFDFMLCSEALLEGNAELQYSDDSYKSYGNSGDCYNSTIFNCDFNNGLPSTLTSAIYYLSDHFPVVMELETGLNLSVKDEAYEFYEIELYSNPQTGLLSLSSPIQLESLEFFTATGSLVFEVESIIKGKTEISTSLSPGVYIIKDSENLIRPKKVILY